MEETMSESENPKDKDRTSKAVTIGGGLALAAMAGIVFHRGLHPADGNSSEIEIDPTTGKQKTIKEKRAQNNDTATIGGAVGFVTGVAIALIGIYKAFS